MQRLREIDRRLALFGAALALTVAGGAGLLFSGGFGDSPPAVREDGEGSLVGIGDLPGTGWNSADTALQGAASTGGELLSSAPSVPECESMRLLERTLAGSDAAFEAGESRTLERREDGRLLAQITHTRMSFADITALDTVASGVESALADGSLANCLDSVAAANGIDLEVQPSPLAAPAPRQGGGRAFLLAAGDNPGAERMVEHIYWWKEGTTLSTLVVSTWGSETDVRAIVAAASGASR